MDDLKQPRISANKLAEFVYANPVRRRSIVRNQKFKNQSSAGKFQAAKYKAAEDYMPQFFSGGCDPIALERKIQEIKSLNGLSPREYLKYSAEGLTALSKCMHLIPTDLEYRAVPRNFQSGIVIEDVYVSMRPDAVILKNLKKDAYMGILKFHFPRTHALGDDGGDCVAVLLLEYLNSLPTPLGIPKHTLCYSLDIPSALLRQAPKAHKTISKEVQAACQQYKMMWDGMKAA